MPSRKLPCRLVGGVRRVPPRRKDRPRKMAPFKEEHFLLLAPGSETTLAQVGVPDPYTPAKHRFPTRMFAGEQPGQYEPHRIREVRVEVPAPNVSAESHDPPTQDVDMNDSGAAAEVTGDATTAPASNEAAGSTETATETVTATETATATEKVQQVFYEEDVTSDEGAIYPIRNGRIVNKEAFFALLQHIYNLLSPPLHTPILMVLQPAWTTQDREEITRFVFENFNTPAFTLLDAARAVVWGFGVQTGVVVDVGKTKADVTAVIEHKIQDHGRGVSLLQCGGDAMTERLLELLEPKGFTREMCEQLKRSDITEILPPGTPLPGSKATAHQGAIPAASDSNNESAPAEGADSNGDEEGVLDVAAIVSGDTSEYLANMEKSGTKKAGVDPKLPNAKRPTATFQYEEFVEMEGTPAGGAKRYRRNLRELSVGVERFRSATPRLNAGPFVTTDIMERLAKQVYDTIQECDRAKHSDLWDSIIIVGGGSKVQGFAQALLGLISQKYITSPSASIFTSEIPSTFSTPLPTGGTNTPAPMAQGQPGSMYHPGAQGVNPLLVAATHNNPGMPIAPGTPGIDPGMQSMSHRSSGHSQAPSSVKPAKFPEYCSEFKDTGNVNCPGTSTGPGSTTKGHHGTEEAGFLGAQVCAKLFFSLDQNVNKSYMSRTDYNELGPEGIRDCIL